MKVTLIEFFGNISDGSTLERILEDHARDCEHDVHYDYYLKRWYCENCIEDDEDILAKWYIKEEQEFEYD